MSSPVSFMDLCAHARRAALDHGASVTGNSGPWWLSGSSFSVFTLGDHGIEHRIDCSDIVPTDACRACEYAKSSGKKNRK